MGKMVFSNILARIGVVVVIIITASKVQSLDVSWRKTAIPNHDLDLLLLEKFHMKGNITPHIVGGEEVRRNSIPYQVAIFIPIGEWNSFCGGSLINRRTVLSAAHCLDSVTDNLTVLLGAHNVYELEPSQQIFSTNDIVLHQNWNRSTLMHDIAIVRLPSAATINEFVTTILLPRNAFHDYVGNQSLVSGWGYPSDTANSISPVLREVSNPIISNTACNMAYFGFVQPSHICMSGGKGRGSCFGDSGGPLVLNGEQIGITSFVGYFGCETGWPPGFVRVTNYLDWIAENSAPDQSQLR